MLLDLRSLWEAAEDGALVGTITGDGAPATSEATGSISAAEQQGAPGSDAILHTGGRPRSSPRPLWLVPPTEIERKPERRPEPSPVPAPEPVILTGRGAGDAAPASADASGRLILAGRIAADAPSAAAATGRGALALAGAATGEATSVPSADAAGVLGFVGSGHSDGAPASMAATASRTWRDDPFELRLLGIDLMLAS